MIFVGAADLITELQKVPTDAILVRNDVGNLVILSADQRFYIGYVDLMVPKVVVLFDIEDRAGARGDRRREGGPGE